MLSVNHWGRDFAVPKEWLPPYSNHRNSDRESAICKSLILTIVSLFENSALRASGLSNSGLEDFLSPRVTRGVMQKRTEHAGADLLAARTIPIEHNPIRKLMLGFLDPSEMTPEERMDELASILAAGFLRMKGEMRLPSEESRPNLGDGFRPRGR